MKRAARLDGWHRVHLPYRKLLAIMLGQLWIPFHASEY